MLSILDKIQELEKKKVSRKALLEKPEGYVARPPRDDKRSSGRDNRRRDNRR